MNETVTFLGTDSETVAKDHPFLEGLSAHQVRLLTDCALQMHFQPGEVIFREGDPADYFYLIQKGEVALEVRKKDHGLMLVGTLGDGDVLGWSWLFPPYFWHFDARALEPTTALCLRASALREECDADNAMGYALSKKMALVLFHRLQTTMGRLLEMRGHTR